MTEVEQQTNGVNTDGWAEVCAIHPPAWITMGHYAIQTVVVTFPAYMVHMLKSQ